MKLLKSCIRLDGLSDNDIDGFLAKLTTSLALEVTQNSNDVYKLSC